MSVELKEKSNGFHCTCITLCLAEDLPVAIEVRGEGTDDPEGRTCDDGVDRT